MNELITGDDWMLKVDGKSNGLGLWKVLFLALFCGMLFVLITSQAEAAIVDSGTCGENLTWTLDDTGTLTINGTGEMKNYTYSSAPWYGNHPTITSISVSNGVTSIGDSAFCECFSLTSITIPNSVTSIGNNAFSDCSSLTCIAIPNSVISIGEEALNYCNELTNINVSPNNMNYSSVDGILFNKNQSTLLLYPRGRRNSTYIIPSSVTSIADGALYCFRLKSIVFPDNIASIGGYGTFNTYFSTLYARAGSDSSKTLSKAGFGFRESDEKYSIRYLYTDNTITGIELYCVDKDITSFTIPSQVISIGDNAFQDCTRLTSLVIPNSITKLGYGSFLNCSNLESIAIPDSVIYIGDEAFSGCSSLKSINISSNVNSIGYGVFSGCSQLTSITIPSNVTSIDGSAFSNCTSLMSIEVAPGNKAFCALNDVLYNADQTELIQFPGGKNISSYAIPSTVNKVRSGAFDGCTNLIEIVIPTSVKKIEYGNFCKCINLKTVNYNGTIAQAEAIIIEEKNGILLTAEWICSDNSMIHSYSGSTDDGLIWHYSSEGQLTFSGHGVIPKANYDQWGPLKNAIRTIVIENGITEIAMFSFSNYTNLTSISIPNSVVRIGQLAFSNCYNLKSITIPAGLKNWEYPVFSCTGLENIYVDSNNAEYISVNGILFDKNRKRLLWYPAGKKDKSYQIPYGVESAVFYDCNYLESLIIPDSVTSLSIQQCKSLKNIHYTGTKEQWESINIGDYDLTVVDFSFAHTTVNSGIIDGNITWCLDEENKLTISGNGDIPDFTGNVPWSLYQSDILSLVIRKGITSIGSNAFDHCINLMNVTLPDTITDIGEGAFSSCTSLRYITIPDNVIYIGNLAFDNCTNLYGILIPDSVNNIGSNPFPPDINIYCNEYSYAQFWAEDNEYAVVLLNEDNISDFLTVTLPEIKTVMVGSINEMEEIIFPNTDEVVVIWHSSNPEVATINENGIMTALKAGTSTITLNAGGKIAECLVTVLQGAESFDIEENIFVASTKSVLISPYNVTPADATLDLIWSTNNSVYAIVSQTGLITGRAVGETTLTVTDTISGLTRTATIYICYPVQTVMLTIDKTSIYAGLSTRAAALVTTTKGQSYENKLVTFSSSDPSVATVDQQGNIQTKKAGTVTITATAANGVTASETLTVEAFQRILSLPARLGEIESEAFAGLTAVEAVRIPEEVYYIADDAFAGSNVIILTPENSYAAQWARDHGMTVIEESPR